MFAFEVTYIEYLPLIQQLWSLSPVIITVCQTWDQFLLYMASNRKPELWQLLPHPGQPQQVCVLTWTYNNCRLAMFVGAYRYWSLAVCLAYIHQDSNLKGHPSSFYPGVRCLTFQILQNELFPYHQCHRLTYRVLAIYS